MALSYILWVTVGPARPPHSEPNGKYMHQKQVPARCSPDLWPQYFTFMLWKSVICWWLKGFAGWCVVSSQEEGAMLHHMHILELCATGIRTCASTIPLLQPYRTSPTRRKYKNKELLLAFIFFLFPANPAVFYTLCFVSRFIRNSKARGSTWQTNRNPHGFPTGASEPL